MKTAAEFIKNKFPNHNGVFVLKNIEEFMIEFAKMHVQESLKQVSEKAELEDIDKPEDFFEYDGVNGFSKILNKNVVSYEGYYHVCINSQSVLNAYPLDLIK